MQVSPSRWVPLAFRVERELPPLRSLRSLRVGTVTDVERVDEGSRDEADGVGQELRLGTGVELVTSRSTLQRLRTPGVRRLLLATCQDADALTLGAGLPLQSSARCLVDELEEVAVGETRGSCHGELASAVARRIAGTLVFT